MPNAPDVLFRTLADPTRRAIFERLCREGEKTVGALTAQSGVSQPAVSKHLGVLRQAGLVRDRHAGRQTHYRAQPGALAPLIDWTSQMAGFWQSRFDDLEVAEKDGSMNAPASETRSVVVEREIPFSPEKIWRALTQPQLIEEWLMKNDFKPAVDHRFNLRGDWGAVNCRVLAVEPNKTLSYTWDAMGLESVVTWTLTPTSKGTHLRMEQLGFYIYSPFEEIPKYAPAVRFVFLPVMLLSGLWMWKGHVVRRLIWKSSAAGRRAHAPGAHRKEGEFSFGNQESRS